MKKLPLKTIQLPLPKQRIQKEEHGIVRWFRLIFLNTLRVRNRGGAPRRGRAEISEFPSTTCTNHHHHYYYYGNAHPVRARTAGWSSAENWPKQRVDYDGPRWWQTLVDDRVLHRSVHLTDCDLAQLHVRPVQLPAHRVVANVRLNFRQSGKERGFKTRKEKTAITNKITYSILSCCSLFGCVLSARCYLT